MASISGSSLYSSMQNWQAKQKAYTATFLNNAATLADDIGSTTLSLSQNQAMFASQQAYSRVVAAGKAKAATAQDTVTVDPYASANAARKLEQAISGTDKVVANATSTTDAGTKIQQLIDGTAAFVTTGSSGDVTKKINQMIAGTESVPNNPTGDLMTLTKIMYGIDKLPLPPKVDVAS